MTQLITTFVDHLYPAAEAAGNEKDSLLEDLAACKVKKEKADDEDVQDAPVPAKVQPLSNQDSMETLATESAAAEPEPIQNVETAPVEPPAEEAGEIGKVKFKCQIHCNGNGNCNLQLTDN